MEVFGDVVLVGFGVALIFYNDNVGAASQALSQLFWGEGALHLKTVYRAISCVFGTVLLIVGVNDFWFHSLKAL